MILDAISRILAGPRRLVPILLILAGSPAIGGEPDSKMYWDVNDVRPGMKGTGQTVMVGTKLEEFGAEVLGVMKGVSPGRDMVLCRLTGCNLEHAGIIQGMSGSPIYDRRETAGSGRVRLGVREGPDRRASRRSRRCSKYVRSNDQEDRCGSRA